MPEPRKRPERAVALKYTGTGAPQVAASGQGLVAERILALAEEAGIPIRRDPALAAALSTLDLGTEIPEELYMAVAEVLAWAYQLSPGREAG